MSGQEQECGDDATTDRREPDGGGPVDQRRGGGDAPARRATLTTPANGMPSTRATSAPLTGSPPACPNGVTSSGNADAANNPTDAGSVVGTHRHATR